MQRPIATPGTKCPLYRKDVSKVCHTCEWFVPIKGQHPQTNEHIDRWGCAMAWAPILAINVAKEVSGSKDATEAFRKEMVTVGKAIVAQAAHARVSHTTQNVLPNGHQYSENRS